MNEKRQPSLSKSHATNGAEKAGPAKVPALKMAVARPRSFGGNHSPTTMPEVGNDAASPAPKDNLLANIPKKVVDTPLSIPAMDQIVTAKPVTGRVAQRANIN